MSDSQKPVDRSPQDPDAILATGGANSDLAGGPIGTKNRSHVGLDPDELPRDESAQDKARSGQNPGILTSQRNAEAGRQMSSDDSAATHKHGTLHEDGLAGQAEDFADGDLPTRDHLPGDPTDGSGRQNAGQR